MIPFSVLDLSPICQGGTAADAFRNTLDLARNVERLGYQRYWLAEHHNMPGIASAATAVVIGHVAAGTKTIRVGSGGIMLPNHAPLIIAEQFGTLESLFPGRIDLGLGRAPGTDMRTARALRRNLSGSDDSFPQDVLELQHYFSAEMPTETVVPLNQVGGNQVRAVPGAGLKVPLWILGSSLFGAQLAAELGLPFGFASHFAPDYLMQALDIYRERFKPSAQLEKPHALACIGVFAADTDAEAQRMFTSLQQQFIALRRGTPGPLPPPVDKMEWSPQEQAMVEHSLMYSVVGAPKTVRQGLAEFIQETQVDELMITGQIYDHAARVRSYELTMEARAKLAEGKQRRAG
ncbi:LLM class flavin-dependent oxidoreductase [Dongia sedimenti]|uniref:LLM class flavin-dependent oxidoreductase n=1 Tax=Dongia sedimenti TaxID=3064282 RepID=A0ABU0YSH0_9PROT|nr:LLM class flavin-dependent oxidoreductase [Rhodospirillaceae bacterium R-7]